MFLGEGMKGAVKDESEWRLELYKKWLRTLQNGVGEPIIESRSDRVRRASRGEEGRSQRRRVESIEQPATMSRRERSIMDD